MASLDGHFLMALRPDVESKSGILNSRLTLWSSKSGIVFTSQNSFSWRYQSLLESQRKRIRDKYLEGVAVSLGMINWNLKHSSLMDCGKWNEIRKLVQYRGILSQSRLDTHVIKVQIMVLYLGTWMDKKQFSLRSACAVFPFPRPIPWPNKYSYKDLLNDRALVSEAQARRSRAGGSSIIIEAPAALVPWLRCTVISLIPSMKEPFPVFWSIIEAAVGGRSPSSFNSMLAGFQYT